MFRGETTPRDGYQRVIKRGSCDREGRIGTMEIETGNKEWVKVGYWV